MTRVLGLLAVILVLLLSLWFAAANAGERVALNLGFLILYRVPVTLVAFGGLLVGMVVMFIAGIHADLRVRGILRERLAEETEREQRWIDRNQGDLFAPAPPPEPEGPSEAAEHPGFTDAHLEEDADWER